jgi:ABC-type nitrate/sulfonate/bicarbonate transport system substrate-binding protein
MTHRFCGRLAALLAAAALFCAHPVAAAEKITVIVFPGMQNLPLFAAQTNGFFAKRGIDVEIKPTPNSQELRDGLAQGRYQIAHSAVDNAVAMAEMAKIDVVVLMGGDNSFNNLYVQPEIRSYADLRGKTVVVDAVDTAYAFQLYAMLKNHGVPQGAYTVKSVGATTFRLKAMQEDKANAAAAMMNPPFAILAEKSGLKRLASAAASLGAYQGTAAFALRSWAPTHRDAIERYIRAYVDGLRWALDPANKDKATALLADNLKLSPDVAAACYALETDPKSGLAKDARVDVRGFRKTLKLRADMHGDWGGKPPSPAKYLDLSYYRAALKTM